MAFLGENIYLVLPSLTVVFSIALMKKKEKAINYLPLELGNLVKIKA